MNNHFSSFASREEDRSRRTHSAIPQIFPWFFSILLMVICAVWIPISRISTVRKNNQLSKQIQLESIKCEQLDIALKNLDAKLEHLKSNPLKQYAAGIGLKKAEAAQIYILNVPSLPKQDSLTGSEPVFQTAGNF